MMFYPISLDLQGRKCLVVGGGPIATGKVSGLLEAGAQVTVVSPDAESDIVRWHTQGQLTWQQREFTATDIDEQFLVIAATDDKELNASVYQLADRRLRVANAVDDLNNCNFIAPAVAQKGALQVAVSTGGRSPALAKQIRDRVQRELLTERTVALADVLGRWRPEVKRHLATYQQRQAFWEGVLDSCLPGLVSEDDPIRADALMCELLRRAQAPSNSQARCAAGDDARPACRACLGNAGHDIASRIAPKDVTPD
jgi:uroporphyrin-III C-methyltransferase/precorrin-2 dehydrogenase/sirohydrochlorin ferrochelatase